MWAFQENIYKTRTTQIIFETFTINSEGSTAQIRLRNPYNVDWGDGTNNNVTTAPSGGNYDSLVHNYGSSSTRTITVTPLSGVLSSVLYLQFLTGQLDNHISFIEQLSNLQTFNSGNSSIISGDLFSITPRVNLTNLTLGGGNIVSGNISGMSTTFPNIQIFIIQGTNTLTGDITSNIAISSLLNFTIYGNNTLSGNISGIHTNLNSFQITGVNTVEGDLSSLVGKSVTTIFVFGTNTITGSISNIPSGMAHFFLTGNNTIYGNTNSAVLVNLRSFNVQGYNTISGLIEDFPNFNGNANGFSNGLVITGNNTISGDLGSYEFLNANNVNITSIDIRGNSDIGFSGSLFNPYALSGITLYPGIGLGLTSTELDNLLIYINDNVTIPSLRQTFQLSGNNAPRTSASDAAVAGLISKGYTVNTN